MLVRVTKLIADVRRNARLDAAGADRDQDKAHRQYPFLAERDSEGGVHRGEGEMAKAVNHREIKDSPVFAPPAIGQDRAEERHPVNRRDELVEPALGLILRHSLEHAGMIHEELGHESDEDRPHPIEAEPLRAFVADDVRNARRHSCDVGRSRCVFRGHASVLSDYGFGLSGKKFAGVARAAGEGEA